MSQLNAAAKRALMVGLLAMSTLGFSTFPSDGSGLAIEKPASTAEETALAGSDAEEDSNEAPDRTYSHTSGFFETVSPAAFPDLAHQRLLPWRDGFLHIWSPPPLGPERTCNIDQLWARFSTDGVKWTEFSDLEIPSMHYRPLLPLQQVTGYSSWDDYDCWANNFRYSVHVASDGERLAVASQWPRVAITWPGHTAEDLALLDQLLENPPSIYLSMTTDLANWETIEMSIPRPAGLHDSLQAAPRLVDLSLDDQGWLFELETARFMNLLSLMPDDIRESAIEARPKHDGPWYDESSGEGMTVEWRTDGTSYGSFPYARFVSWDELGTTSELYYEYGAVAMKPYLQPWHYSGSIFAASWGQSPTRFELPWYADGIVRTESGYVGLSDHSLAGYDPSRFGPAVIGFSSDGETWDELGPIAGPETWIRSIHAVNAGVLAFSSPAAGYEGPAAAGWWDSRMGDDPNPANGVIYWLGDPDGSNWRPIELPEGATLIEWLMANDRAPVDWPRMAVNGDIVLRIADDGSIQRYVVPGTDEAAAVVKPEQSEGDTEVVQRFTAVSVGVDHSCGLYVDGTVDCWGLNVEGQAEAPRGQFRTVVAGIGGSCGLRTDGSIECWGVWGFPPGGRFASLADGSGRPWCAVRGDGSVVCWGSSEAGVADAPSGPFVDVAVGGSHACGRRTDITIECWGDNSEGQADAPGGRFVSVTAGSTHSCGLTLNDRIVCWGGGEHRVADAPDGRFSAVDAGLGYSCGVHRADRGGTMECWGIRDQSVPAGRFTVVSVGEVHFCGVRVDGVVVCWGSLLPAADTPDGVRFVGSGRAGATPPEQSGDATEVTAPQPAVGFTAVGAGYAHSCGLRADGTVDCWGWGGSGQFLAPDGRFSAVAVGVDDSCGLRPDGTIECWGAGRLGQAGAPDGRFSAVAVGGSHSCGLRADGTVVCWGRSQEGQLDAPRGRFAAVAAGYVHSCGLRADGTIACWGDNHADPPRGQFDSLVAGRIHSCGLRTDGTAECWGSNRGGQADAPGGRFVSLAAGRHHSCGVRPDGTIDCWGTPPIVGAPGGVQIVRVDDVAEVAQSAVPFSAIAVGGWHSCGLRADGTIACWGWNFAGQVNAPEGEFVAVTVGGWHSCGLRADRTVECWGWNGSGQVDPPGGRFVAVAAGAVHSCGLRADGTVECWGDKSRGQGDVPDSHLSAVTVGGRHSCGLRADGTVACWGNNGSGQADPPAGRFSAVAAGGSHSCGLRADGTVVCWGSNRDGQADAPDGRFSAVTAGAWHSCGLRADGGIVCWGSDKYGLSRSHGGQFTAVAAGEAGSCGLRPEGTVECWGRPPSPQARQAPDAVRFVR